MTRYVFRKFKGVRDPSKQELPMKNGENANVMTDTEPSTNVGAARMRKRVTWPVIARHCSGIRLNPLICRTWPDGLHVRVNPLGSF